MTDAGQAFEAEMQDDVNTAGALAAVFGLLKAVNEYAEAASLAGRANDELLGEARDRLAGQLRIPGIEFKKGLSSTSKSDPLHGFEAERATPAQLREIAAAFGEGARRAREAGLDGVEIHGANGYVFTASVSTSRPPAHFTPRVTAWHPEAVVPVEAPLIAWQR